MEKELKGSRKTVLVSLYALMVFTLVNTMANALVLDMGLLVRLLMSTGISTVMLMMLFYPMMWFVILGFIIVGGIMVNRFFPAYRLIMYEGISGFLINLFQHIQGKEVMHPDNVLALWMILVGILSLLTAMQIFRKSSTWPLLLLYGTAFLVYWYSHIDLAYTMLMLFLLLYLILYSLKKYQLSQQIWTAEGADVQQNLDALWQKTTVVYGLIIVVGAALLPQGNLILEWRWFETRLVNQFPVLVDLRGSLEHSRGFGTSEYFNFASTGFQDSPQVLGGPVQLSDRLVMTVKAPRPFYLRGNVKSFYQHNAWGYHEANAKTQEIHKILSPEALGVINGKEATLSITYNNFSSATIFTPYQPFLIENQRYGQVTVDDNYQLTLEGGVFKNELYTVKALIPVAGQVNGYESTGLLPVDYLQLPNTINQSIAQLTDSITRELTNDYAKAIAIQDYLRNNHAYSLDVSHTPPGREFVDVFLFDTKEGYCTYFATSLVVMLRLEGIPSRYVEGYLMPQHSQDGIYEVRQKNAHAWVEAYFQGLGWVTLEPTPAYPLPEQPLNIGNETGISESLSGEFDEFLSLLESMETANDSRIGGEDATLDPSTTGKGGAEDQGQTAVTVQRVSRLFMGLVLSLLAGLFLRITWVQRRFQGYQQQLAKLTTRGRVIHLYGNVLELLAVLGYPQEGGETPFEFSRRISKQLYDLEHHFENLTEVYVLAQYSQMDTAEEASYEMEEYLKYIDQRNRYKIGVYRYLYTKYLRNDYYSTQINKGS